MALMKTDPPVLIKSDPLSETFFFLSKQEALLQVVVPLKIEAEPRIGRYR